MTTETIQRTSPQEAVRTPSRRAHTIFIIATLLYWCSLYTYVPILSPYLESIPFSYTMIGIVLGSYGLLQLLVRFPLGMLSDRLRRRKPFVALGFVTSALGCLMFLIFQDEIGVTAARAMTGVSASTWVAFTVLYASYFTSESATKAMGSISVATVAGQLLGMGGSGFMSELWGWSSTFWLGGLCAIAGLLLSFLMYEPKEGIARTPMRVTDLTSVVRTPLLLKVSFLSILAHAVLFITMFGFTPSYAVSIGANQASLSILVFAFMIPHAAASWLSGNKLTPRYGAWPVILIGLIVSGICTALIPTISAMWLLYLTQAVNGFAQGMHLPLLLGLSIQNVHTDKRATAMGFYQAVYALGMFSGPFFAGWLNESFGLTSGFLLGGIIAACAALLTGWWWKQSRPIHEGGGAPE